MARPSRFPPEVRERAVRMVFEHAQDHASQWAAITSIGCAAETLRSWVRQAERDGGRRPGLTTDERARFKQLERENVELRRVNEILRLALGLRGGGEGGTTPALGAVVNAVVDALAELGVEHLEMPVTPERVWSAIHAARAEPLTLPSPLRGEGRVRGPRSSAAAAQPAGEMSECKT